MLVTVKKVFEDAAAVYYENGQGSFQNHDSILNLRPVLRNLRILQPQRNTIHII